MTQSLLKSPIFVLFKFEINIFMIVWKLYVFRQRIIFGNFQQGFHHNFRLKGKFWILTVSSARSGSIYQTQAYFEFNKYFFIHKIQFIGEKNYDFFVVFFKLLTKLSNFVNYDDSIGKKIVSNSIRIYPVFI